MFTMREVDEGWVIELAYELIVTIKKTPGMKIYLSYCTLEKQGDNVANAFLAGVVEGCCMYELDRMAHQSKPEGG